MELFCIHDRKEMGLVLIAYAQKPPLNVNASESSVAGGLKFGRCIIIYVRTSCMRAAKKAPPSIRCSTVQQVPNSHKLVQKEHAIHLLE